jgi:hypothetical protein
VGPCSDAGQFPSQRSTGQSTRCLGSLNKVISKQLSPIGSRLSAFGQLGFFDSLFLINFGQLSQDRWILKR